MKRAIKIQKSPCFDAMFTQKSHYQAGYRSWFHFFMMTSSNGNIFRVTGHLCGEFTGERWIPRTKDGDAEFWRFFYLRLNNRLSKQSWGWWFETLSRPLWRHRNVFDCVIAHVLWSPHNNKDGSMCKRCTWTRLKKYKATIVAQGQQAVKCQCDVQNKLQTDLLVLQFIFKRMI